MSGARLRKRPGHSVRDKSSPGSADRSGSDPTRAAAVKAEQAQAAEAELVAYYRPIGIAAVAAAFTLR